MQLHHNIDLFDDIAVNASESLNIDLEIIRKDYFVTLFLKEFLKLEPGVIFKGGTSLSKCYKIINRFSEDIDLSFHNNGTPVTANERRDINHHVQSTCEALGFKITNESKIKSRAKLNIFRVNTGFTNKDHSIRDAIIVETAFQTVPFPVEKKIVSTYLVDYLKENGHDDIVEIYELNEFEIYVQGVTRTLIDKVFAICDYYLDENYDEKSRHIYDLYKLWPLVKDTITIELIDEVRKNRASVKFCHSAKDGIIASDILQEIVDKGVYESDYSTLASTLLFEDVSYEIAINAIKEIKKSRLFG
jgi:predicted nucleotidyltransferase component of viral defense system